MALQSSWHWESFLFSLFLFSRWSAQLLPGQSTLHTDSETGSHRDHKELKMIGSNFEIYWKTHPKTFLCLNL